MKLYFVTGKKRYDDKPYSDHFEMTPVISSNPHSAKADLLSRQIMTSERMPLALNDAKNVSQGIVSDARYVSFNSENNSLCILQIMYCLRIFEKYSFKYQFNTCLLCAKTS